MSESDRQLVLAARGGDKVALGALLTRHRPLLLAVVSGPEGAREIDARPSDALNMALLLGAPIRVEASVLDACRDDAVDTWTRQEELTDGATVIAARVTERWSEVSGQQDAADEGG